MGKMILFSLYHPPHTFILHYLVCSHATNTLALLLAPTRRPLRLDTFPPKTENRTELSRTEQKCWVFQFSVFGFGFGSCFLELRISASVSVLDDEKPNRLPASVCHSQSNPHRPNTPPRPHQPTPVHLATAPLPQLCPKENLSIGAAAHSGETLRWRLEHEAGSWWWRKHEAGSRPRELLLRRRRDRPTARWACNGGRAWHGSAPREGRWLELGTGCGWSNTRRRFWTSRAGWFVRFKPKNCC